MITTQHYDKGENNLSTRNQSRIIYLRSCNNWIKSTLIKQADEILKENGINNKNLLDLACGKGGDLYKWKNLN